MFKGNASSRIHYHSLIGWGQLPPDWDFVEIAGVSTDSQDRVYVFNRGEHPVIIFESDGRFIGSWGENVFARPHGICIGPDDSVYCTDDIDHTIRKFTSDGRLLMTLGTSGKASDTGCIGLDYRTIYKAGPPFNRPTNLAIASDGSLIVTDGYCNARVHRFAPDGQLLGSWGEPGCQSGQFNLPHGVAIDDEDRVYIADRENSRIQVFSLSGVFLAQWTDVARPVEVFIDRHKNAFVAELGLQAGLFPWQTAHADGPGGRVSIFDVNGCLQERWGSGKNSTAPGVFFAPHDVWADKKGDVYVGEVAVSAAANGPRLETGYHVLQKFTRVLD